MVEVDSYLTIEKFDTTQKHSKINFKFERLFKVTLLLTLVAYGLLHEREYN